MTGRDLHRRRGRYLLKVGTLAGNHVFDGATAKAADHLLGEERYVPRELLDKGVRNLKRHGKLPLLEFNG